MTTSNDPEKSAALSETPSGQMEKTEAVFQQSQTELTELQTEILENLAKTKSAEERVRLYGEIVDKYGLDAIVSLLPLQGDLASSLVSTLYLLAEAHNAGLEKSDYIKIIALQMADVFVGAIPVAGDISDYLFKANQWSGKYFEKQTKKLLEKAQEMKIPDDQLKLILERPEKLTQVAEKVLK